MFDVLIRNGRVVDGSGLPWFARRRRHHRRPHRRRRPARQRATAKQTLDAAGKVVCPGFIDAHVHGDLPCSPTRTTSRPSARA